MSDEQLDSALDLMRRLPPQNIEENLGHLLDIVPELADDLLSSVDQPLKVGKDSTGRDYLLCDYNRDADSYRSPWTNEYDPPLAEEDGEGTKPTEKLRELEITANKAFDTYREMYYQTGVSSVYLWDIDNGFAGVILIKKTGDGAKNIKGCWDAVHVIEVLDKGKTANYKLTSTIMLWLQTTKEESGTLNLGGSMTRQVSEDRSVTDANSHICNIGTMIEELENQMRNYINEIYFGKTQNIANDFRKINGVAEGVLARKMQAEIAAKLGGGR